jgi:hypothetical protein
MTIDAAITQKCRRGLVQRRGKHMTDHRLTLVCTRTEACDVSQPVECTTSASLQELTAYGQQGLGRMWSMPTIMPDLVRYWSS